MLRAPLLLVVFALGAFAPTTARAQTDDGHDAPLQKGFGKLVEAAERGEFTPEPELSPRQVAEEAARDFFLALVAGDARNIAFNSAVPFFLEDRRITDRDELGSEWLRVLRSRRVELHVLYGVEVYTPQEMEEKYGKPPARLANLPWKAPRTWIAVGNLSGRPAVALLREFRPGEYLLTGFHD